MRIEVLLCRFKSLLPNNNAFCRIPSGRTKRRRRILDSRILPSLLWRWHPNRSPALLRYTSPNILQLPLDASCTRSRSLWPILDTHHPHIHPFFVFLARTEHISIFEHWWPEQGLWLWFHFVELSDDVSLCLWDCCASAVVVGVEIFGGWRVECDRGLGSMGIWSICMDPSFGESGWNFLPSYD